MLRVEEGGRVNQTPDRRTKERPKTEKFVVDRWVVGGRRRRAEETHTNADRAKKDAVMSGLFDVGADESTKRATLPVHGAAITWKYTIQECRSGAWQVRGRKESFSLSVRKTHFQISFVKRRGRTTK